jgi:hypothetical protein
VPTKVTIHVYLLFLLVEERTEKNRKFILSSSFRLDRNVKIVVKDDKINHKYIIWHISRLGSYR